MILELTFRDLDELHDNPGIASLIVGDLEGLSRLEQLKGTPTPTEQRDL